MYIIIPSKFFLRKSKKILSSQTLKINFERCLNILKNNPFSKNLSTHKVQSQMHGTMYSSRVTNDIRLIWNFDQDNAIVILLIDIGGHEGGNKVYK